jgi:hypothetical protein
MGNMNVCNTSVSGNTPASLFDRGGATGTASGTCASIAVSPAGNPAA